MFAVWILVLFISFYILAKTVDEYFIKSLDNIAHRWKLSPSVAGATLLAAGTSAPELSTALFALFLPGADPATGLGTIVGSAIFQILVVIGFTAYVKTSYLNWKPVIRDGVFYSISILLLIAFISDQKITLLEASILLVTYFAYLGVLLYWTKHIEKPGEQDPIELVEEELQHTQDKKPSLFSKVMSPIDRLLRFIPDCEKDQKYTNLVFFLSIGIIAFFSYWLVIAAEAISVVLDIPTAIIALTILAGGSSIPELVSSYVISKQGRGDMAIANAIGSNIFDILVSLGLPVFIFTLVNGPLDTSDSANITSSVILLFVTLIAVLLLLASQKFKINRQIGIGLIATYVLYVIAAYSGLI